MFLKFKPFFLIADTPLHPGSGSELGIVDLPIQRERHTNFPKIEGSGLKGCIRKAFENSNKKINIDSQQVAINDKKLISLVFGPEEPEEGEAHAGSLAFADARILLFPVKSFKGIFAWITCPLVIERFKRDLKIAGIDLKDFPNSIKEKTLSTSSNLAISSKVVLEEFTFDLIVDNDAESLAKWLADKIFPKTNSNEPYKYWKEKLQKDLVILPDDVFTQFVTSSTEVVARTAIDNETSTVKSGALWYEEYLPQDVILYSIAMASPVRVKDDNKKGIFKGNNSEDEAYKVIEFFTNGVPDILQIGGNQTLGKGIVKLQIFENGGVKCQTKKQ